MNRTKNKPKIFLDSGAYTAQKKGNIIDIQDYIYFIKRNNLLFHLYANLDVIRINGYASDRRTAEKTLKNQQIMEEAGLHPLPCFHYGEPFEYLQFYVSEYDYICLGLAESSDKKSIPWLDVCFSKYINDRAGTPKVRVHVYGKATNDILLSYPFHSSDSTKWHIGGRYGGIYVPRIRQGKFVYDEPPHKVCVSNKNPAQNKIGKHLTNMMPSDQKLVMDYIYEKGFKLGSDNERGVSNDDCLRNALNCIYFTDLENYVPNIFLGVSTLTQLSAIDKLDYKPNILISYRYCKENDKLVSAIRNYKDHL